ncbi:uncharacterized protein [Montipora foliosa]|uniref:uncharacterized protein n=1 Tax=Montipora foliosa TaxID=591990 RepID=UPI0035F13E66
MVQDYENNIILPPIEFRDGYKPVPLPRTKKPVPLPRTIIEQTAKALKGYTKSFEINIKNNKDPLMQLQNTRKAVANHIENILISMKGLKFVETLKVTLTKMSNGEIVYKTAYFNSPAQTIINNTEIDESLKVSKQDILNKIAVWISEGSGWTVESVENHYLNIVKYEPMKGSSYIKLPHELRNSSQSLINIKNSDNECFRWCHIRHLNPQDRNPQRIKKSDKAFIENLNYSGIEFPVTTKQYNKIEKHNEININVFGYEEKQKYPIYVSKEKYEDYFEAITEKIHGCQPNNDKSFTEAYQKHTDCGYGYKVVCCYDDKYTKPVQIYRGEKAVYKFMEKMLEEVKYCKNVMKKYFDKPLKMTKDDEDKFQKADKCHICEKKYNKTDVRVRDHCHVTGQYRGSAHQDCNLNFIMTDKIPVIFHNLRGYDCHFIMQEIGEIVKKHTYKNKKGEKCQMNINAIPNNMEKYMAFMLGNHLTFIDSFQFMSSSLGKLVSNLPKEALIYTSQKFKGKELDLMSKKGVYPYDFMDSFEKFNEKLPPKEEFYSVLNDEHISDEDYTHAQNVWNTFSLKNMGEYHDLYLKSDILLLADVFENFRKTCLQYYKLDPCHYFTSPGLSWDAMLKMTKMQLELMTDIDMFQFIEKGMRGGRSYIANRYGEANNRYMKTYDNKTPSKYIMYLDANNLYGWAMSQYLPNGGFRWMTEKQLNNINLSKYSENSIKGLILEVDLAYPKELHDLHNDYPLAPEKILV